MNSWLRSTIGRVGKAITFSQGNCPQSPLDEEAGEIPDVRAQRLIAEGRNRLRPVPNEKVLRLFLSRHVPRKVELGCRIEFMGRKWRIARTLKKTVWLAIRPENAGFYVLEARPDPTNPVVPRILAKYRF